jgi:hypothetical protein
MPPHTPRTSEPDCLGLILQPVAIPPFLCTLCIFILGGLVAGCSHCHVWLVAQDVMGHLYGFFLAMGGIFAVSRSRHPVHECTSLFSLLPLWGQSYSMSVAATIFYRRFL